MRRQILLGSYVLISLTLFSQRKADDVIGIYWTETKEGKVEIFKQDRKYFGKILWRKDPRKDLENPDKSLRKRSVIGLVFLRDFQFNGDDEWEGGTVYSIDNGNTYSGKLWLEENNRTLKMRGFVGFALLGRTATLTRVED